MNRLSFLLLIVTAHILLSCASYEQHPLCVVEKEDLSTILGEHDYWVVTNSTLRFNDLFKKSISDIIEILGAPENQTGWIDYIDTQRISFSSKLFVRHFPLLEIPIKAYAWDIEDGVFICLCTFDDIRFHTFPMNITDSFDHVGTGWLASHSEDDGFKIFYWGIFNEIHSLQGFSLLDSLNWVGYEKRTPINLLDYYYDHFNIDSQWTIDNKTVPLRCLIGRDPTELEFLIKGKPMRRIALSIFSKYNANSYSWMLSNQLPFMYNIDRYNLSSGFWGEGYLDVIHWRNKVQYIEYHSKEPLILEY